jgi:hypothetical protein
MAVIAGDLVTRLGVDGRRFQSGLDKARGQTRSFAADVTAIVSGIAIVDVFKSSAQSLFGLATGAVGLAASAETASIQFRVLTGSAESAAKVMDDINKFAANTPFESMEITQAAKQLIAFGGSAGTVISELQTLGDLSAGMGIPLTELAEIYGKARIQGRLFMEDINQLQGRGINVTAELAKEFGNVREAVEKGQVNFGHLERALRTMTTEGGAFAGMMQDMSKSFEGQTSTLVDNIKAIGRGIGEFVLPQLTGMLAEANAILAKFNELPDRIKFVGDVIDASMDVAFLAIKDKWKSMLRDMVREAIKIDWMGIINPVGGQAADVANALVNGQPIDANNLGQAQAKLAGLLGQVNPAANGNGAAFEWQGPREQGFAAGLIRSMKPKPGEVRKAFGSLFAAIGSDPLIASAKGGVGGMLDRAKIQAEALAGTFSNWFGSPDWDKSQKDAAAKQEPQLAGAMAQGSQEAFSTIFAAMLKRGKDPNVAATEKQTRELKQVIKDNKPQKFVTMGLQFL